MTPLDELAAISRYADRLDLVQAGGGNTSVKPGDGSMFVKASGFRLRDVAEGRGIVRVDARQPSAMPADTLRPSIEVAVHAVLGRLVCHTHPVLLNAFLCVENSRELIDRMFGAHAAFWYVPYVKPGIDIASALTNELAIGGEAGPPGIVFLENHGLVVQGDSCEDVIARHEGIAAILAETLGPRETLDANLPDAGTRLAPGVAAQLAAAAPGCTWVCLEDAGRTFGGFLFPDAAVYCGPHPLDLDAGADSIAGAFADYQVRWGQKPRVCRIDGLSICLGRTAPEATAVAEVWWAHGAVETLARTIGTPRYLPEPRVRELLNWDAEWYRQSVAARVDA